MAENNSIRAGRICGNPLTGLCERVVIEVRRVYDGSVTRMRNKTLIVHVSIPEEIPAPYTFLSSESCGETRFEHVRQTPVGGGRTHITGDLIIPCKVCYKDANGVIHSTCTEVTLHRDIFLNTPQNSLVPCEITNHCRLACDVGTFLSNETISMVVCVVILTKCIVLSDIVVPSYGRAVYPEITDGEDTLCNRLLDLEIFPPLE